MTKVVQVIEREPLYEQCAFAHPLISTKEEFLGGVPHLEGTSLTVGQILARVYVHGSIKAVVEYYADVSQEQIKEAISYAQTFIEAACDPYQETRG
jgi:uncharacterized protein (DUF433 family)